MKHILIAGGTGLVGSRLKELAQIKGFKVSILTRIKSNTEGFIQWNPTKNIIDENELKNIDYLINLSGANIAKKVWTAKRKKELVNSRVNSTEFLLSKFSSVQNKLKAVVSASAIGYYKSSLVREMKEDEDSASGFMGELCKNWEQTALQFKKINVRTIIFRIGIVLSNKGGAYVTMSKPAKLGLGSYLGTGKQKMPWVHIDDLCNMILMALENKNMNGIYNSTVPDSPNNKLFTRKLLESFNAYHIMVPTPEIILKTFLGERAEILLNSYNPSAEKLLSTGFQFVHTNLAQTFISLK